MRLFALALLCAIGVQALEPIRAPLERTQGSAFSAATLDLALVSQREQAAKPVVSRSAPPQARLEPAAHPRPLAQAVRPAPAFAHAPIRAPPPRGRPGSPPDATAPPRA
nr:hypothetical protein [Novosphingobium profundi]